MKVFETKSFNLAEPNRKDGWMSFQAWTRKWNRFFATIFCVLSFMLLFAIVVVNVIATEHEIIEEHASSRPLLMKDLDAVVEVSSDIETDAGCFADNCRVICQGMIITDVEEELNSLIMDRLCFKYDVHLNNIIFPNETFPVNWLVSTLASVTSFYLTNSPTLRVIEGGVFDSRCFRDTTYLLISEVEVQELSTNVLKGLSRLETLELQNLMQLRVVSSDFLEPVRNSLKKLTLERVSLENPINLTGVQALNLLETINFNSNNFGNNLNDATFKLMPSLKNLYLNSNQIQSVTSGIFSKISSIRFVDLTDNQMISLPENVLKNIHSSSFRILLTGNPWMCDCNLHELQLLMTHPSTEKWFDDNPVCRSPAEYHSIPIKDALFCISISPTEDTDIETTIKATVEPIECLICAVLSHEPINCSHNDEYKQTHQFPENNQPIAVRRQRFTFRVKQVDEGVVEITVENPKQVQYVIFWFSESENVQSSVSHYVTNEKLCAECTVLHENRFKVSELNTDFLYTFCLMEFSATEISPFDCLPFKTYSFFIENSWLMRQDKFLTYSISAILLLLCSFIGAFIMYCIIRKMPTLLKGSERVIIVKDKEVIVMPSGHKKLSKTDSEQSTSVESVKSRPNDDYSAYLTPYPNVKPVYRKIHHRRASDSSVESARSYISTLGAGNKSSLICYSDFQGRCFTDLKDVPNTPPPLPQRRSIETENAVDYARIAKSPDGNIYIPFDYGTTTTNVTTKVIESKHEEV